MHTEYANTAMLRGQAVIFEYGWRGGGGHSDIKDKMSTDVRTQKCNL